jgi:Protein kinase domain
MVDGGRLARRGGVVGEGGYGDASGSVVGFDAGRRVAGYRLEDEIGRGGMAVVFRARDERLGRLVALKILAPAYAADEGFRHRFIRESRAAAAVDDPHIVPVFEAGEADGVLFIAMRYVPGGDARSLVRREGPMPPARAVAIISPVASALDAAHAHGLLHRDVKPANMLVDVVPGRPDHVYLSDFGLSKGAGPSTALTGAGQFLGTLDYISPEQIRGGPTDGRADQYALACAAFELLTGGPPFWREEPMALMHAQLSDPPPELTSRRPDLPPAADEVLARALAKAPEDRYPRCRDFADALRGAFGLPPYDSGPRVIPAAAYRPTRVAGPADGAAAAGTVAGAAAAGSPGHRPGAADLPTSTGEASIPPAPAAVAGYPQPPPAAVAGYPPPPPAAAAGYAPPDGRDGHEPQRARRRRVRIAAAAAAVVVVVAGAGVLAALLRPHPGPVPLFSPIAARSAFSPVTGEVYVEYRQGSSASAELSGEVKRVTKGEVAQLYAQQFPYSRAPVPAGSVILHPAGATARYAFRVTPTLATRYTVDVFGSSTATAPLATSASRTIYVATGGSYGTAQTCTRPVCHETLPVRVLVPAPALSSEISKPWYVYFNNSLSAGQVPAAPRVLLLNAGGARVTAPQRVSADEFERTITLSFSVGNDAYNWNWTSCNQDTEAQDGMGLPGHHGCGAPSADVSASYLG